MKIDLYTKGVLTVIAFALIVMVFKDAPIIKEAIAAAGVSICDTRFDSICAQVTEYGALHVYCANC
mgnify:CR=1 FL=1